MLRVWTIRLLALVLLSLAVNTLTAQERVLDQPYRLNGGQTTLEEALDKLIAAGAPITYRNDQVANIPMRISGSRHSLEHWLSTLLSPTELTYELLSDGRRILIYPDPQIQQSEFTLFGTISDARSGERLINANIYLPDREQGVITNEYGYYAARLKGGRLRLRISYVGYREMEFELVLKRDSLVDVALLPDLNLRPIIVTALPDTLIGIPGSGKVPIGMKETEQLSGPGGEADPMRMLPNLPGITTGADGLGGIGIRGSDPSQNLILLDGVPVYNLNHAAGLFSIFNSQVIRRVDLYKDGIPSRFGGRLAGVIDVHTRDGNLYANEASFSTSLLSSRFTAEGPLVVGESSFLVSGRYFWMGNLLPALSRNYKARNDRIGQTNYQLYDLNLKLNNRIGEKDRIYFSFYSGLDDLSNTSSGRDTLTVLGDAGTVFRYATLQADDQNASWGNTVGAIRWNHLFNDRLFSNFSLTYSNLDLQAGFTRADSLIEINFGIDRPSTYAGGYFGSDIEQVGLRFDGYWYPRAGSEWSFGIQGNRHSFSPRILSSTTTKLEVEDIEEADFREYSPEELTGYLEYLYRKPGFVFRAGLRAQYWNTKQGQTYFNLMPRMQLGRRLSTRLRWQITFDATVQPVHLLSSISIGLPTDVWVPSTSNIHPSRAYQLSTNFHYLISRDWELEVGGFAKQMENLLVYRGGTSGGTDWENRVSQGDGEAVGLEFSLKRRRGKLRGWLSYTLARSDRQFDELVNLGRSFPYRYDRRHSIAAVLIYQFNERSTLSLNWQYASGAAYSFSLGSYESPIAADSNEVIPPVEIVTERNGFRLPANHRLDINYQWKLRAKPGSRIDHIFSIGLYNAYDRHNPIYYELRRTYQSVGSELKSNRRFVQVFIAPVLPVFSYRLHIRGRRQ